MCPEPGQAAGLTPRAAPLGGSRWELQELQALNRLEKLPESQRGFQGHKSLQDLVDQRGIITRDWEMGVVCPSVPEGAG